MSRAPTPSVLWRQLLPVAGWWLSLVAAAAGVDVVLHFLRWPEVGRWLGGAGTALLVLSFLYSLKKRKLLAAGTPGGLLKVHEVLGWVGTLLVLVHGGIHFNALLPWLALGSMVVVAGSGLTGSVLLKGALAELKAQGVTEPSVLDGAMVGAMKRWRVVHLPLNAAFTVLALWHIVSALVLRVP